MADVVKEGAACACGSPLPWHLFDLMATTGDASHTCRCHREYRAEMVDGRLVVSCTGFGYNPISDLPGVS